MGLYFPQVGALHDGAQVLTLVAHTAGPDYSVSGVSIRLDEETIEASIEAVYFRHAAKGMAVSADEPVTLHAVPRVISLLLYLCSEAAEIGDGVRRPRQTRTAQNEEGYAHVPRGASRGVGRWDAPGGRTAENLDRRGPGW